MTRTQISQLMDAESCFNAKKAVELGFADGILYSENQPTNNTEAVIFYRAAVTNSLVNRIQQRAQGISIEQFMERLDSIK